MIPTVGTPEAVNAVANRVSAIGQPTRLAPQPSAPPDPGTYHLFEYQGDKMLFDLRTGVLLELNEFAYDFLSLCREHADTNALQHAFVKRYPSVPFREAWKAIEDLSAQGLFRHPRKFTTRDMESYIQTLWRHHPRRLQLVIAQHCNLKCTYCYMEQNESNDRHVLMTEAQAFQAVDHLVQRSGRRRDLQITFFGGEPTLNFDLIKKVVAYCNEEVAVRHNKTFIFELITNGTRLSGEIADFVNKHDFLLFVSLDGWREMNNTQRPAVNGQDYHETILRNAIRMDRLYKKRHARSTVKVRANLTAAYPDAEAVTKYFESHGFTNIGVAGIFDMPGFESPTPGALTDEQLAHMKQEPQALILDTLHRIQADKRVSPYGMKMLRKTIRRLNSRSHLLGMICGAGRNTNAADTDGNIYPCHRYVNMKSYVLGNTHDGLDRQKTKDYYRMCMTTAMKHCSACWVREYCKGGCTWDLAQSDGHLCERPKSMCDGIRESTEFALWLRKELRRTKPEKFEAILRAQGIPDDPLNSWKWSSVEAVDEEHDC